MWFQMICHYILLKLNVLTLKSKENLIIICINYGWLNNFSLHTIWKVYTIYLLSKVGMKLRKKAIINGSSSCCEIFQKT